MVLSFSKDNFGKFHQDLPLLQLFEGLKMGVFLHKNVKTFNDGISCVKTKSHKGLDASIYFFIFNIYPKVYLCEKITVYSYPLLTY